MTYKAPDRAHVALSARPCTSPFRPLLTPRGEGK